MRKAIVLTLAGLFCLALLSASAVAMDPSWMGHKPSAWLSGISAEADDVGWNDTHSAGPSAEPIGAWALAIEFSNLGVSVSLQPSTIIQEAATNQGAGDEAVLAAGR